MDSQLPGVESHCEAKNVLSTKMFDSDDKLVNNNVCEHEKDVNTSCKDGLDKETENAKLSPQLLCDEIDIVKKENEIHTKEDEKQHDEKLDDDAKIDEKLYDSAILDERQENGTASIDEDIVGDTKPGEVPDDEELDDGAKFHKDKAGEVLDDAAKSGEVPDYAAKPGEDQDDVKLDKDIDGDAKPDEDKGGDAKLDEDQDAAMPGEDQDAVKPGEDQDDAKLGEDIDGDAKPGEVQDAVKPGEDQDDAKLGEDIDGDAKPGEVQDNAAKIHEDKVDDAKLDKDQDDLLKIGEKQDDKAGSTLEKDKEDNGSQTYHDVSLVDTQMRTHAVKNSSDSNITGIIPSKENDFVASKHKETSKSDLHSADDHSSMQSTKVSCESNKAGGVEFEAEAKEIHLTDMGDSGIASNCKSPFEDPDKSDSFDDKVSLCSDEDKKETPISRAQQVAADRDRKNPAYIPRTGKFFMHDEREGDDITLEEFESCWLEKKRQEQEQMERKKGRIRYGFNGDRWGNDKFDEKQQCPKTYDQIISEYGYDIREDGQAARKKYWDGSYKYGKQEDNREWKRRPRGGNDGGMRGRRSGGRGRSNQGSNNRFGPGNRSAANTNYVREHEKRNTEDSERDNHHCSNTNQNMVNRERLTGRDPQPNDNDVNGRGNRPRTMDSRNHRSEFKGKASRPPEKDQENRSSQESATTDDKAPNITPSAPTLYSHQPKPSTICPSVPNNTTTSIVESPLPKSAAAVNTALSVGVRDSYSKNPKPSTVNSSKANVKQSPLKEEPKIVTSTQTVVDVTPSPCPKGPLGHGYAHPSNKRYSAQRRERKSDREGNPSNSRRHQQSRQQVPMSNQASHAHQSSQMHDSHNQSKQLQHMPKLQQQKSLQLPPQSPDSQPPLSVSQMPQQAALRSDVAPIPQVNYQSMHGGIEYPPHASVIPSMSPQQQELTYFGPPPTSVHQQYLLNYFRAIPADPNLQFFAQQQVAAAAAAALANGQFPPSTPATGPEPTHYPAPENAGGTVFYPPVAQQQQPQPPQLTPERPRRALPIVAPSAGTES